MQFIKEKSFYKTLVALAFPIALQDLIKFGLNLMDNVMVGAVSEAALSGVSLANQPFFMFSMLCFGLAGGGAVLITQYYGKKDMAAVRKVVSMTLSITIAFSVLIGAAVLLFPEFFMRIFTDKEELIPVGVEYLRIVGWTYFLYGISNTLVLVLRSVQVVKVTLLANAMAFVLNVFLNWVLIFGKLGMPALGVRGAAIATLIARFAEFLFLLVYIRFRDKVIGFRFHTLFRFKRTLLRDFVRYSTPVVGNEFIWGVGISMISVVLGRLGSDAVAASSIASSVQQVATVIVFGICNAACIIIGREIGAGRVDYAKQCANTCMYLSVGFGFVLALGLFFLRGPIVSLYEIPEATKELSMSFLIVTSLIVFIDSISTIAIVGVMRGGGDTKYSMYVDVLTLWLLSIPLGLIGGLVLHLPALITYILLRIDVPIKAILCYLRMKSGKWVHNVTREEISQ